MRYVLILAAAWAAVAWAGEDQPRLRRKGPIAVRLEDHEKRIADLEKRIDALEKQRSLLQALRGAPPVHIPARKADSANGERSLREVCAAAQRIDSVPIELGLPTVRTYEMTFAAVQDYLRDAKAEQTPTELLGFLGWWRDRIKQETGRAVSLLQLSIHYCSMRNTARIYQQQCGPATLISLYQHVFVLGTQRVSPAVSTYEHAELAEESVCQMIRAGATYDGVSPWFQGVLQQSQ